MKAVAILLTFTAACATRPRADAIRFANAPAVQVVDDRRDVPVPPAPRRYFPALEHFDGAIRRPIVQAFELRTPRRALGVNALDEVPDSTWFTNRIGVRALTPDAVFRGPTEAGSPEPHTPWTIVSTKSGGSKAPGFVIRDARGITFLLKLDLREYPEYESASHVIVNRILWAAGYNVPEDHVVHVHPQQLVLAADAEIVDPFGGERPLDRAELDRRLALAAATSDGRLRGMASRFLDGELLGGHPSRGRRRDDPNDLIPHERRRDLRGAFPLFAWVDHVDIKENNTLDVWIEDPADPRRHYVEHYLIDFGKSLGAMATISRDPRLSYEHYIDTGALFESLITLGLVRRPWEARRAPLLPGVGLFDAHAYDPGTWKPLFPEYEPLSAADVRDKFWGAKLVMRFTRDQLRAAVAAGQFSDPRSAEYILDTLVARQRKTALHWFERTSPLDRFAITGDLLCFDDLTIAYALAPVATQTRYRVTRRDARGARIGQAYTLGVAPGGRTCAPLELAAAPDGYTMFEIVTARPTHAHAIHVHVARAAGGEPRVIGIWRP